MLNRMRLIARSPKKRNRRPAAIFHQSCAWENSPAEVPRCRSGGPRRTRRGCSCRGDLSKSRLAWREALARDSAAAVPGTRHELRHGTDRSLRCLARHAQGATIVDARRRDKE
jgi:hypothetical protein